MNLSTNLSKLKFAFITINYHPTDIDSFNVFFNSIFLPYIKGAEIYNCSTEFDGTAQRHLHCVLGYTSKFAPSIDRIRQRLSGKKILAKLDKIYNTKDENAFKFDYLDNSDTFEIYKTIGYCFKSGAEYIYTNMIKEDVDATYKAYLYSESKPIAPINHNIEHKQLSKGNLLSYMYDSYVKGDFTVSDIPVLESYMIQHCKLSFVNISQNQKCQALRELNLRLSENKNEYVKYKTDGYENIDDIKDIEDHYFQYINPRAEMAKEILYLRRKVVELEKL